jgi:drug/metabolite transporter (DMT)-like permease
MIYGTILVTISAFSFALSTAIAKQIVNTSDITSVEITFFRFLTGFLLVLIYIAVKRKSFVPQKMKFITLRAVFNTTAVIFFFSALQYTTVTKTNMLNMTYPLFVFLLSPILNREKISPLYYLYLIITMAGLYMIIIPGKNSSFLTDVNAGDILALISGILAAFAISYLRETRKHDSTYIILFYLMLIGTVINTLIVLPLFVVPRGTSALYLFFCTTASLAGQFTITLGYRYISSAGGALVSSSRIVFAAILGISFFNDPLTCRIISGGILIMISLAGISGLFRKKTGKNKKGAVKIDAPSGTE